MKASNQPGDVVPIVQEHIDNKVKFRAVMNLSGADIELSYVSGGQAQTDIIPNSSMLPFTFYATALPAGVLKGFIDYQYPQ